MRYIKPRQANHPEYQPKKTRGAGNSTVFIGLLVAIMAIAACSGHERRTTGTVLNDQNLEYEVLRNISADPAFGENDHIKVEVHQGVVLLAGETTSEEKKLLATTLAEKPRLAERVINDLQIGRRAGFGGKLDNAWLTTKVESILAAKNPIEGSDVRRIKVVSSQNTVYLMGLVTREEGEKIAEVVRNIGGVERVVKVFDYTDN